MFAATGTLLKTVKEFENDWKVRLARAARVCCCAIGIECGSRDLDSTDGAILRQCGFDPVRGFAAAQELLADPAVEEMGESPEAQERVEE